MIRVHVTTRKGIGVSPSVLPAATTATAAAIPIPTGANNAHRLLTITPANRATANNRMMVMAKRVTRGVATVQPNQAGAVSVFRERLHGNRWAVNRRVA